MCGRPLMDVLVGLLHVAGREKRWRGPGLKVTEKKKEIETTLCFKRDNKNL